MSSRQNKQTAKKYYWIYVATGLAFMLLFPQLPALNPITKVGMYVIGSFIGMVILWSTVDSIWPSILGLIMIAWSGYKPELSGYSAIKQVFAEAFGAEIVITVLVGLILFSAIDHVGGTKYIVRFFMTRKFLEGRPYVFLFTIFFCAAIISGLTQGIAALLILWPIATEVCEQCGYKKGDKLFYVTICGIYLGTTLGQPLLPFKGAIYIVVSAFEKVFHTQVNYASFILYELFMIVILLIAYLLFVRFVLRPDASGFKNIKIEDVIKEEVPKMNFQQKAVFIGLLILIISMLLPNFISGNPVSDFLNHLGGIGQLCLCLIVLMVIQYNGKPILDFKGVARNFAWSIYFLVAAALYACNALTNDITGFKAFLLQYMQPVLGGHSNLVFVIIVLALGLFLTNIANNAGITTIILPVVAAFADQYPTLNMTALSMSLGLIAFVALLTPAASPYAAMLHGRTDLVTTKEIETLFIPMLIISLVLYIVVGFRVAGLLFH